MGSERVAVVAELSPIVSFEGRNRYLSNLWHSPVELDGSVYLSVEHAYQAARTFDPLARERIRACAYASEARKLGDAAVERAGWSKLRVPVMLTLLRQKFAAGTRLSHRLLATDDAELVWVNSIGDTYWGVHQGRGQNMLGELIMQVRAELERM